MKNPLASVLLLLFFICLVIPVFLAITDIWNIPRKGNYDEISAHGIETQGSIEARSEEGDADDDHWLALRFKFSHDGREYHGVAYSNDWAWKPGYPVTVRYLGEQAILPDVPPVDINPENDFLLVLIVFSMILSPVSLGLFLFLLLSVLWKPRGCDKRDSGSVLG